MHNKATINPIDIDINEEKIVKYIGNNIGIINITSSYDKVYFI